MNMFTKLAAAAVLAAGAMAVTATSAMADIVCNQEGECWPVRHYHYEFKPEIGVVVHPDSWRWGHDEHYKWHEHSGRGYWRNGIWIRF